MSAIACTEIISSLRILLRCLCRGKIDTFYDSIDIDINRISKARIIHNTSKNELWVVVRSILNPASDSKKPPNIFELSDPRSIGAVIRCVCRLTYQHVPSFDAIDEILNEGPPAWVLDE